ncbi:hypothetical protein EYF80_009994 [Liparis tanakae]|uniref:Uncharacterized protein n=1 Tax=Liparis tanakae TaxID=230148 RepID=A0A4Z2IPL8_9TELE|nr:hypothetical protein EYF80_009994 [Liparis tanakae]
MRYSDDGAACSVEGWLCVFKRPCFRQFLEFERQRHQSALQFLELLLKPDRRGAPEGYDNGCGQKFVLQAWDIEGLRWRAQPGEGFPWTRHWIVLACTPPPHVTVHCAAQRHRDEREHDCATHSVPPLFLSIVRCT